MKELNELAKEIQETYQKFYQPDMIQGQARHLIGEVLEFMEAEQFDHGGVKGLVEEMTRMTDDYEQQRHTVRDELADIMIMALGLCSYYRMDIEWWIIQKMQYNSVRTDKKYLDATQGEK